MISLGMWLAILLVCFGAGAAALRRLRAGTENWAEEVPFAVGLGMGILGFLVLAVGLLGQLKVWVGIVLVCLLAALGWRHIVRLAGEIPGAMARVAACRWGMLPPLLFFLAAGILTLIGALAPATDMDYDGLVYHLAIPKVYLRDGAIHPIPWLSHSNFPFTLEMLYLLGLLLRDQSLAKLFHFGCGWLTICAIFAFGRRWWSARAGWLAGAIFLAIPLVAWQMMSAYNELAFALYAFLGVYALARWFDDRRAEHAPAVGPASGQAAGGDGWLWVAAIMCGLALGVKMLAAALLVFALAALGWALVRGAIRPRPVTQVIVFAAIAGAVASPWYIKSYLWTGNPVYPFFYQVFDGQHWSAERARLYADAQAAFGLGSSPLAFLALPWKLTMRSRWFFDQPDVLRPFNVLIMVFGPLLLALLPTLFVVGPVGRPGRLLLWFALCYAAIWFGLTQNGRYLIPVLPALSACAGCAAARLLERRWNVASATAAALLLGLLSALYPTALLAAPAARVAVGAEAKSTYLTRASPIYPMFDAVNRATPPEAKILVLGNEPRCFYLDRDYLLGNHAEIFEPSDLASADALLDALKDMEVSHLLLHSSAVRDMRARSGAIERLLDDLDLAGRIRRLGTYGSLSLWQVEDARSAKPR